MKRILSLFLLFGCLFIMDTIFPYQAPCNEDEPILAKEDEDVRINLAKYTALESDQVARTESGDIYRIEVNTTPYKDAFIENSHSKKEWTGQGKQQIRPRSDP